MLEARGGSHRYDVAVVGGGPAGSTAATLLAQAGHRVVLFEKERFPRFHIGESLLPFNLDLLERLGVLSRMRDRFVEKWGARLLSSDGSVSREIRFENGFVPGHPMAFQVLRSDFDEMLLRNATSRGTAVFEGHTVVEARASHRDGCVVVARGPDGAAVTVRARFLLDASGRDAFLASRRHLRVMTPALRKAAVFAHYAGVPRAPGRSGGSIILIFLRDGWFWMIPLPNAVTSVGLVTEGALLKSSGLPPQELLEESLRRCPAARQVLGAGRRTSEVFTASDYSYTCREVAGDGYLLLGDAAAFIDPVFSTGVWLGMSSAALAADLLVRALARDDGTGRSLAPRHFAGYSRKVERHIRTYMQLVTRFYGPGFLDLFLQPQAESRTTRAVISLLAGMVDPPLAMRARLWWFYLAVRLQRSLPLRPRVPFLSVLENAPP